MNNKITVTFKCLVKAKQILSVLLLLFFLLPSAVSAFSQEKTILVLQQDQPGLYIAPNTIVSGSGNIFVPAEEQLIYISNDATIYGKHHIKNARIVAIVEPPKTYDAVISEFPPVQSLPVTKLELEDGVEEKLLGEKVNAKVLNTFYTSSEEQQSLRLANFKLFIAAGSSAVYTDYYAIISPFEKITLFGFLVCLSKVAIFTSNHSLQSYKLSDALLRGPPMLLNEVV